MYESNQTSEFLNHDRSDCNYLWAFFLDVDCFFKFWGYVYKVTLTTPFLEITDKKGRFENIMFYITFYYAKKYKLMNCTKLLFKQNMRYVRVT